METKKRHSVLVTVRSRLSFQHQSGFVPIMNSGGSSFSSKIAAYGGRLVTLPLAVDEALKGHALLSIVTS